jgi:hypothetical protein
MHFAWLWKRPLLLGFLLTLAGFVFFAFAQKWNGIELSIPPDQLVTRLSPLILASAFIERAVEILISPWRDTHANKLQRVRDAIKARPNDLTTPLQNAQNALDLQAANDALDNYRGDTQRYAFAVGLFLSFCAAVAGLRAHWPFLAHPEHFEKLSPHQQEFFRNFDVAITTALLAGGADGFHAIVNSVTGFFTKATGTNS